MMRDIHPELKMPVVEPFGMKDLATIPRLDFLYGKLIARGYLSLDVAEPKVGKTALGLLEAVDNASGGKTLGQTNVQRRTMYYNAEDTQEVLDNRIAAILILYGPITGLRMEDIKDTLFVVSGYETPDFYLMSKDSGEINVNAIKWLRDTVASLDIEILYMEPLQDLTKSPETNEIFRILGRQLRNIAGELQIGIKIFQHTRKMNGTNRATMDDARGGSSLRGVFRFNRTLSPMSEEDGAKFDVNHKEFFCYGDSESNLTAGTSGGTEWFRKVGVECPNGDNVVAVLKWSAPKLYDGISNEIANTVRLRATEQWVRGTESAFRQNKQSKENYIGEFVADACGFPFVESEDKSERDKKRKKADALVEGWIDSGVLVVEKVKQKTEKEYRSFGVATIIQPWWKTCETSPPPPLPP